MLNCGYTGVTETLVKQIGGDCACKRTRARRCWSSHRVQIAGGITAQDHRPSPEILDRETKEVKFNRNRVVSTDLSNRKKVFDKRGSNECWKYALEAIINGYYYISLFMVIVYCSCYNCIVRKS